MSRRRRLAVAVAAFTLAFAGPAAADDLDDELAEVESQIDEILADIGDASSDRTDVVDRITATQSAINELRKQLAAAEQALEDSTWQLNLQRIELDRAREELADAYLLLVEAQDAVVDGRAIADEAVRRLYMGGGVETPGVVLSAASITEAMILVDHLERVSADAEAAVAGLEELEADADRHRSEVVAREAAIEEQIAFLEFIDRQRATHAETIASQTALVAERLAEQRALLADVDAEIAFFEGELAALEQEQSEIEALIAAETEPSVGDGGATGAFVRPVPGAITSPFGPRLHPILGYTRMHSGVDMSAPYGQSIRSMSGGRVILAASYGGYGTTVIVDHGGGMTTLYAHQSSLNVSYGDTVQAGDIVGYAGSSGLATGPHLHFEVRINGEAVDPAPYLAGT